MESWSSVIYLAYLKKSFNMGKYSNKDKKGIIRVTNPPHLPRTVSVFSTEFLATRNPSVPDNSAVCSCYDLPILSSFNLFKLCCPSLFLMSKVQYFHLFVHSTSRCWASLPLWQAPLVQRRIRHTQRVHKPSGKTWPWHIMESLEHHFRVTQANLVTNIYEVLL